MLDLTAKIVSAYLRRHEIPADEIPQLIQATHAALIGVSQPALARVEAAAPSVAVKKSITADAIICLECGKPQQMIKRHLRNAHGMTPDEYRAKWSLRSDYPMVAPNYAAKRSQLAIASGLGQKRAVSAEVPSAPDVAPAATNKYPPSRWSRPKA